MTLSEKGYALLAKQSYDSQQSGDVVTVGNTAYTVFMASTPSILGFQGTAYQSADRKETVIAYRGTEVNREPVEDGVVDAAMALAGSNPQRFESDVFTQQMIDSVRKEYKKNGERSHIAVTGHSLSGALAQLNAACLTRHARRITRVAVAGMFISLAACASRVDPNIQFNPDASMRYRIEFRIDNATVTADTIEATAFYEVTNENCVPRVPISGVRIPPQRHISLQVRRLDRQLYATDVVADLLRDEDYFGLGVCHWSLSSLNMMWQRGESQLSAGATGQDLLSGVESTLYYPKAWDTYGRQGFAESGSSDISSYRDRNSVFTIAVRAKEIAP